MTTVMLIWILALVAIVATELLWRRLVRRPWMVESAGDESADAVMRGETARFAAWSALGLLLVLAASAVEELPYLLFGHRDDAPGTALATAVAAMLLFAGLTAWLAGTRRAIAAPPVPAVHSAP